MMCLINVIVTREIPQTMQDFTEILMKSRIQLVAYTIACFTVFFCKELLNE